MGWRDDRTAFLLLCLAALAAALLLPPGAAARFRHYGFGLPPLAMLALAAVVGATALTVLARQGFFAHARRPALAGLARAAAFGTLLALPTIVFDLARPLSADINTPLPEALLFYPAIVPVAEAAFHLLPLALVFALTRRAGPAILAAALTEPAFQTAFPSPGQPLWQTAAVALDVFAFGLAGLTLFRRHGLAALVGLRITYYLWWHILWGEARLGLLF